MDLAFDLAFEPRYGEAVTVAPGVRRVTAENPGPFTFHGTNTFLIGDDELAVLDPGPDDPAHVDALLRAAGRAPVTHILVSHAHLDHVSAVGLLREQTGASVLAASRSGKSLDVSAETARSDAGSDPLFAADRILGDGAVVEGPGYRLEVVATPGHASDHLAFALSGQNLLFSGDHVMGWATTVVAPPDGSMGDYMASLERLLERPETLYLPAHGGLVRDAHVYLRALRAHRRMRERLILRRLQQGDRTVDALVAHIYRDLDPRLRAGAALSTLAHLQDLVARGFVAAEGPPTLSAIYSPAETAAGGPAAGAAGGATPPGGG
jgi:glyoxylase-like metal-dependent hydrolase (beta-lactamase superfamily II)